MEDDTRVENDRCTRKINTQREVIKEQIMDKFNEHSIDIINTV